MNVSQCALFSCAERPRPRVDLFLCFAFAGAGCITVCGSLLAVNTSLNVATSRSRVTEKNLNPRCHVNVGKLWFSNRAVCSKTS